MGGQVNYTFRLYIYKLPFFGKLYFLVSYKNVKIKLVNIFAICFIFWAFRVKEIFELERNGEYNPAQIDEFESSESYYNII